MLLRDTDLSPGYTFDLLMAANRWRGRGALDVKLYLEIPDAWSIKRAKEAVEVYRKLVVDGVPPRLAKSAKDWLKWTEIPDPLTIRFPDPTQPPKDIP